MITESDWNAMAAGAVARTHKVYPFTPKERLAEDLQIMIESLVAIARGQEPEAEVAPLTLGEYAPEMTAPHRMDLMVSAMTRDGAWHCNQKCLHCYAAGQPLSDTPELTTAQWKEILTKLRAANIPQVTFTGGEPTLRADRSIQSRSSSFIVFLTSIWSIAVPSASYSAAIPVTMESIDLSQC